MDDAIDIDSGLKIQDMKSDSQHNKNILMITPAQYACSHGFHQILNELFLYNPNIKVGGIQTYKRDDKTTIV